jgi:alpha-N-acetylglucosaminidase
LLREAYEFSHTANVRSNLARLGLLSGFFAVSCGQIFASPATVAAAGVLRRTVGAAASSFALADLPSVNGMDVYEVEATGGHVRVSGSSAVAISRGAYEYIRDVCKRQVTWGRAHVELPHTLPDYAKHRVVCPNRYRHYFNVCTFGYSTVWWDWSRWEQEIDWMALHGINMPLAMNGQEAIWQKIWRSYGLSNAQIQGYFSGPAFLPWHRMGNINSHGGPLQQSWIDGQAALQKRILGRERELQMTPITPAFSGFVPPAFREKHPSALITESSAWAGFQSTLLLNPRDPMYLEIGKQFITEYRKEFGTDHLYLADVYNEMTPRLPAESKLADLQATGDAVYKAILAADPQGTWVMQGWLFYNDRGFWGEKETDAFLKAVPDDRMIIIDLSCDSMEIWRAQPAVRKKMWIYCTLHNFGETTTLFGDLKEYADRPMKALTDAGHGGMSGMGITMEGIEQNPVVYELATDMMWRSEPVDLAAWIKSYSEARYGVSSSAVEEAWAIIFKRLYNGSYLPDGDHFMLRPGPGFGSEPSPEAEDIRRAINLLLGASNSIGTNHLYQLDVVDLMKRYLEEVGSAYWFGALSDRDSKQMGGFTLRAAEYFKSLDDLDRLLGTIPEYRLSTWVQNARKWGRNSLEKDQLEQNAKMQVTVWGGPDLHDYAWKEWSGLVSSFYKERWTRYLRVMLESGDKPLNMSQWDQAIADWELGWTKEKGVPGDATKGEPIQVAKQLMAKYPLPKVAPSDPGIAVGKPVTVSGGTEPGHEPEFAVDGRISGGYWAAHPYPQWLQIDLEKVENIDRIQIFSYHDGERFYQYTIEGSIDGKTWTQLVDASQNKMPASARGASHKFKATDVRFVRVNMLFNSANVGVHLTEVKVFRSGSQ